MLDIKYFVRTAGTRILDDSYKQIEYTLLIDNNRQPVEHFIESLKIISHFNAILLEDDLVLCKNFDREVRKAVESYPNRIINFFQNPYKASPIEEKYDIWWNQCTFYPQGLAGQIADTMRTIERPVGGPHKNQYSYLESDALRALDIKLIQYRPHLVQHKDFDTLIFNKTIHMRRSIYFIDYLKQLNISYDEAKVHSKELRQLMSDHFEKLSKGQ